MTLEEWRPCPGREDVYEVSSLGRIRNAAKGGALLRAPIAQGYRRLIIDQRRGRPLAQRHLHRLVCEAFHGPPPSPDHHARHLDGDSLNNLAENLTWGTARENTDDRRRHGNVLRGSQCGQARLTDEDVATIRREYRRNDTPMGPSRWRSNAIELASRFGVRPVTIRDVVRGRTYA